MFLFLTLPRSFFFLLLPTSSKYYCAISALWLDLHFFTKMVSLKVISELWIIKAFVTESLLVILQLLTRHTSQIFFLFFFSTKPLPSRRLFILIFWIYSKLFSLSHTSILSIWAPSCHKLHFLKSYMIYPGPIYIVSYIMKSLSSIIKPFMFWSLSVNVLVIFSSHLKCKTLVLFWILLCSTHPITKCYQLIVVMHLMPIFLFLLPVPAP